jgi:hypothetical protein
VRDVKRLNRRMVGLRRLGAEEWGGAGELRGWYCQFWRQEELRGEVFFFLSAQCLFPPSPMPDA